MSKDSRFLLATSWLLAVQVIGPEICVHSEVISYLLYY